MGENKTNGTAGSTGFVGLLALVFIVLKLCKVINWSWLWVLSPVWISAGLVIIIFTAIMIAYWCGRK